MDMSYFNYCQGLTMTSKKLDDLFGGPPRQPESPLTEREMDIAASIQQVTEEIMLRTVRHVHAQTGLKNLCLAGGVALNCVGNGRILREGPFDNVWIQPAAGDSGGALGVALFIWHQLLDKPRTVNPLDAQQGSLLGPSFSDEEIRRFLDSVGARYTQCDDDEQLCTRVADLLASEKVVGWMQGRMEFGPRALGSRSILGDARSPKMQSVMNLKIKFRESFRPFAPSILQEDVQEFFEIRTHEPSPYMLMVAPVQNSKRIELNGQDQGLTGVDKLKIHRSEVPAITHVDYSARVQTVDEKRNGRYYKLIKAFKEKTGCPLIINTSFNVRGEPIVCTPEHAYRCFLSTNMDVLVLERFVLLKQDQPDAKQHDIDDYLAQFQLD
jgi:carbamoyltransferase